MHVLILCTGNSARSIIGEVLLRDLSDGRVLAHSAGSHPKDEPHPAAMAVLEAHGHATGQLSSKSWDVFAESDALPVDIAITVCDNAAGEVCPIFPGAPIKAHWGIEDPAAVAAIGQPAAFERAYAEMRARVEALCALPFETMPPDELMTQLERIGRLPGATHG